MAQTLEQIVNDCNRILNRDNIRFKMLKIPDNIFDFRKDLYISKSILFNIDKEIKNSEATLYEEILSDASYKNDTSRKNALELEKNANTFYQELLQQKQKETDTIAEIERKIERELLMFKAICIEMEQSTAIINTIALSIVQTHAQNVLNSNKKED